MRQGVPLLVVALMAGCSSLTRSNGSLVVFSTHLAQPSGTPVAIGPSFNVTIQLSGQNQSAFASIPASVYFAGGGDGSYSFQSVPPGTYTVKVIVSSAGTEVLEAPTRTVTVVVGSTTSASIYTRLNPDPSAASVNGIPNGEDNCPWTLSPGQTDTDGDSVGDACDNCPTAFNPDQTATITPGGAGDACSTVGTPVHYNPAIAALFAGSTCTGNAPLSQCHTTALATLGQDAGLAFDAADSGYSQLYNVLSTENTTFDRVSSELGPNNSYLYLKITGSPSISGDVQPPPPNALLTSAQISAIRSWIEQGANP